MADFHQEGVVTTLHSLYEAFDKDQYLEELEQKLADYATHQNITLLLPCLYSELKNPEVLDPIVNDISQANYIHSIVVALGGANYDQFSGIALHRCDIVTYDRLLLGRLIEPVANPNNDFEFCTGFYARISPTERAMKGRVPRLFVVPFVDAMMKIMRERGFYELENFFHYHRSFNYPLAGEFSFSTHLARGLNIAYDWGLELSTLSEVYNKLITKKIAQVDLARNYEHKHQEMSPEDAQRGLHRMAVDIAKFYLNYMRSHGFALDDAIIDMILHTYYQNALNFIKS